MIVLYCIVKADNPIQPSRAGGLPGAGPVRTLALPGGLTAVVASVPEHDYAPSRVEAKLRDMDWVSKAALGHEQLLEAVMRSASAVLPMKLLTLFSGDDRLLKDLSSQAKRLKTIADSVEGCEEYGLRVVARDGSPPAAGPGDRPTSGTAFLERKKQVRDEAREQSARRAAFAREAFETLKAASRDAVTRPVQADDIERPMLDSAFLVDAKHKSAFGKAADSLSARAAAAHCLFKLTGPWPPYHFVQMEHAS